MRETLSVAAELQLPEMSSVEERDEYVNNLLFKLGLVRLNWKHSSDTMIFVFN